MVDSRTPGLPSWCARTSSSQMLCANALARVTSCRKKYLQASSQYPAAHCALDATGGGL